MELEIGKAPVVINMICSVGIDVEPGRLTRTHLFQA